MTIEKLLEEAKEYVKRFPPTYEDKIEMMLSFAYGNIKIHNPEITREMIKEQFLKLENEGYFNKI